MTHSVRTPNATKADRLAHFLQRRVDKAIREHALIRDGDRILVAVSGGKDSLTLLDLLHRRQHHAPERYELTAARLRSDYHCGRTVPEEWLDEWCSAREIPLLLEPLFVADEVRDTEASACFRCSWNRRKALFLMADRVGCSKIAFGHHADDRAETILLNLLFAGQFRGMEPRVSFFAGRLTIIRPLAYVEEREITPFALASGYPIAGQPCPSALGSKRTTVRRLLGELEAEHRDVKRCILGALARAGLDRSPAADGEEGISTA